VEDQTVRNDHKINSSEDWFNKTNVRIDSMNDEMAMKLSVRNINKNYYSHIWNWWPDFLSYTWNLILEHQCGHWTRILTHNQLWL